MRIRYLIRLKEPIRLEDHWPVSILGGKLRVVSSAGKATAFEITFTGKPLELAPTLQHHSEGDIKQSIVARDTLLPFVKVQLEKAFTYLQCYFNLEILIKEIEIEYSGETEEEEKQIRVKGFHPKFDKKPLLLPYDLLTRAIMAAETGNAPEFEATLVNAARTAMLQERYIDSFRYSFLLIEALFGAGKFKTPQLKQALKDNDDLKSVISKVLRDRMKPKSPSNSDTEQLLEASPSTATVIDHLVDKRGFYFHGNVKRKDAWRPHAQESAEALCLLSMEIALQIAQEAAAPMFSDTLSRRHFEDAKRVGATMTMNVKFQFQVPNENFERKENIDITVPGTKATPKMATDVAQKFLEIFGDVAPDGDLKSAVCTVKDTGQKVFDIEIHVKTNSETGQSDRA